MADDPYLVLGVSRIASDDEIRRAYLKLVKELHPDVNPTKPAEERFKKVSGAYDIVGDAEKRRRYDRGEIDANGEPRRHSARSPAGAGFGGARPGGGGGFSGFDTEDIFSDIFGGFRAGRGAGGPGMAGARSGPTKGPDIRYTLDVDFVEAVQGTKKRVNMPEGGLLDLNVPEGVKDGQTLRLKGKGSLGPLGGEPGDALVEIRVRPHALFRRDEDNVVLEVPITIDEAVIGGKIEVPTVSGRVSLTIPKGANTGQTFRIKGKGVKGASGALGDQLVTVKIVMPDTIDEGLSYFFTEWRKAHKYDPGRR